MNIQETTLPSGLRVITAELPGVLSASTAAFVQTGSRDEGADESGIAHFLEHMAFKGTSHRTALQIAREVEELGSHINAFTSDEMTAFYVNGLGSDIASAAAIIGDVLTHSIFDDGELNIERGVVLQEIARAKDDSMDVAYEGYGLTAYPQQALGRPILGSPDFIKQVQPQNFRNFMGRHYHTGNLIVIGSGDVHHESFVDLVAEHFADIPTGVPETRSRAKYGGGVSISNQTFEQVTAILGLPTVSETSATALHHKLMSVMFGGHMSSPLFQEVREKRGLVYSTGAYAGLGSDHGTLAIHAGTTPENVFEFFKVACGELTKMMNHTDERDLRRAKNTYLVNYATRKESPFAMAQYIASSIFNYGSVVLPEAKMAEVRQVSMDDVRAAAAMAVRGRPTISLSGPVPEMDYEALVAAALC